MARKIITEADREAAAANRRAALEITKSDPNAIAKALRVRLARYRASENYRRIHAALIDGTKKSASTIADDFGIKADRVYRVIDDLTSQGVVLPQRPRAPNKNPPKKVVHSKETIEKANASRLKRLRESDDYKKIAAAIKDGRNRAASEIAIDLKILPARVYTVLRDLAKQETEIPKRNRKQRSTEAYRSSEEYRRISAALAANPGLSILTLARQLEVLKGKVYRVRDDLKLRESEAAAAQAAPLPPGGISTSGNDPKPQC